MQFGWGLDILMLDMMKSCWGSRETCPLNDEDRKDRGKVGWIDWGLEMRPSPF
jgi:hypothetical protein